MFTLRAVLNRARPGTKGRRPMARATRKTKIQDKAGKTSVAIEGDGANINLGGNGHNGDIRMMNADGELCVRIDGGYLNFIAGSAMQLLKKVGELTLHALGRNKRIVELELKLKQ
jgi:hypothetical protein